MILPNYALLCISCLFLSPALSSGSSSVDVDDSSADGNYLDMSSFNEEDIPKGLRLHPTEEPEELPTRSQAPKKGAVRGGTGRKTFSNRLRKEKSSEDDGSDDDSDEEYSESPRKRKTPTRGRAANKKKASTTKKEPVAKRATTTKKASSKKKVAIESAGNSDELTNTEKNVNNASTTPAGKKALKTNVGNKVPRTLSNGDEPSKVSLRKVAATKKNASPRKAAATTIKKKASPRKTATGKDAAASPTTRKRAPPKKAATGKKAAASPTTRKRATPNASPRKAPPKKVSNFAKVIPLTAEQQEELRDQRAASNGLPPTGLAVGIQNLKNYCYISSVVQCFFHIPPIREMILKGSSNSIIHHSLASLFYRMLVGKGPQKMDIDFFRAAKELGKASFAAGRADDAHSFFTWLVSSLPFLDTVFNAKVVRWSTISNVHVNFETRETSHIMVPILENPEKKVHEWLREEETVKRAIHLADFAKERATLEDFEKAGLDHEGINFRQMSKTRLVAAKVKDTGKEEIDTTRSSRLISKPPVLVFQASKYEYKEDGRSWRHDVETKFDREFDYDGTRYYLHAVVVNVPGHYYAHVCVDSANNYWYKLNDSGAHPISPTASAGKDGYIFFYVREDELAKWMKQPKFKPEDTFSIHRMTGQLFQSLVDIVHTGAAFLGVPNKPIEPKDSIIYPDPEDIEYNPNPALNIDPNLSLDFDPKPKSASKSKSTAEGSNSEDNKEEEEEKSVSSDQSKEYEDDDNDNDNTPSASEDGDYVD